ncbi:MAG TPA: TIGR02444 family protein [Caulobacteraceae bacterium]
MNLWDFAGRVHARPGVEAACLALQDDHGQCVSFLLWRLWTLADGRPVDGVLLGDAVLAARSWEAAATAPLRLVRRRLKTAPMPVTPQGQAALREAIKAAELQSERLLLEALETMTPKGSGLNPGIERGLMTAALAWGGGGAPKALLRVLAQAAEG